MAVVSRRRGRGAKKAHAPSQAVQSSNTYTKYLNFASKSKFSSIPTSTKNLEKKPYSPVPYRHSLRRGCTFWRPRGKILNVRHSAQICAHVRSFHISPLNHANSLPLSFGVRLRTTFLEGVTDLWISSLSLCCVVELIFEPKMCHNHN